jgi:hypothetical protein
MRFITAAEVQDGGIDLIYHGGDISYARGYMAVWDFFLNMIAPMASRVPYLTIVGKPINRSNIV